MTALELYRDDRQKRKNPDERLPRQEYFALLRDTLHDELMREGRSDFLEEMLAECSEGKSLPMLEFAALRECSEMIVENRPMQDASEYVPHIYRTEEERFAWRELDAGVAYRVNDPETAGQLSRLQAVSRQLVAVRDQTLAPDVSRAARREIDALMTLNRALEADAAALRQERDELRTRIAQLEEGVISQQLQQRIEVRSRQAGLEMDRELARRRQEAEGSVLRAVEETVHTRLGALQALQRETEEQQAARAGEYQALRADMQAQLQRLQGALENQMNQWQTQLLAADHRFLARSCASLMGAAERETVRVLARAQQLGADDALLGELAGLQATLDVHIRQLEQALTQLGMRIFRPGRGERFDTALHSPFSAGAQDAQAAELVIARVEAPGVLLQGSAGQAPTVLVKAVVHTERKERLRRRAANRPAEQEESDDEGV